MTQRMESSFTRKLGIFIMTLLLLAVVTNSVPFLLSPSYADSECHLEEDVELLNLGRNKMILYWEERSCDPEAENSVKYQTSLNKGKTWSKVQLLVEYTELGSVEDFDGISEAGGRGRLVASFAVIEDERPKLKVMTSDNYGQDWNDPDTILNISEPIPNSRFLHCPALSSQFDRKSKVFTQLTTIINEEDTAYIWLVNSRDGGKSWDAPLKLGEVPTSGWCD